MLKLDMVSVLEGTLDQTTMMDEWPDGVEVIRYSARRLLTARATLLHRRQGQ